MRLRTLVTAAALSAASVAPLVATAPPADAVTYHTWKRLAMCESSLRWHINTGNGYYGGLQISKSTWDAYGGRRYARLPSRASKWHQIRIAERIKRHQGWGAWPACASKLGLY